MLILALDTSSSSGSIAFLRDDRVIGTIGSTSTEIYSSRVFRHLDFLLSELSLRLEDFDLFAVAAGPGSFTGLRVGLAAAKGWAEVFGKPIAPVSALDAVAAQARSEASKIAAVMDARRNELYWGLYRRNEHNGKTFLVLENHEMVGSREEFVSAVTGRNTAEELAIVTPTPEALASITSQLENRTKRNSRVAIESVSPFLAPEIGRIGWRLARERKLVDALTLDANYIRRSDAELHWKGSAGS